MVAIEAVARAYDELREQQRELRERRKTPFIAAGIDVRKALAAYRKYPPFAGNMGRHVRLTVSHTMAYENVGGHAKTSAREIRLWCGREVTPADVLEVLVHEMCHLACPPREGHGERFRLTLRRAARELWLIDLPLLNGYERNGAGTAAYEMDRILLIELSTKIRRGEIDLTRFAPDPPAARPDRSMRMAALVEDRAQHAARMLARAERRLSAAERVLARWRAKVRYYEKVRAR